MLYFLQSNCDLLFLMLPGYFYPKFLLVCILLTIIVRKLLVIIEAIINGQLSVASVNKTPLTNSSGEVTKIQHN